MFKQKQLFVKLFSYQGSKSNYLNIINNYVDRTDKKIYVEPFLGSGAVFFNLRKSFDEYHLAEKNSCLLNCIKQLLCTEKGEFKEYCKKIFTTYNNNINDKANFLKFREYFNNDLYNTNTKEEGFALIILVTCSINGLCRFGKNGYNTASGNRPINNFKINRVEGLIEKLKQLKGKIYFYNDYEKCIKIKNSFQFIDPPYFLANGNYNWKEDSTIKLLKNLDYTNEILYTDIENKHGDFYFKNKQILRELISVNANSSKYHTGLYEVLYANVEC